MDKDYKQKYEDLMKRCEEFNIWFENHKLLANNFHYPIISTTTPFPPNHYNACTLCRIDLNKATHYVCHHPTCPTQIKITC